MTAGVGVWSQTKQQPPPPCPRGRTTRLALVALAITMTPSQSTALLRPSPHPHPAPAVPAASSSGACVHLSFVECVPPVPDPKSPAVLLIHGLDSSAHTWKSVQPLHLPHCASVAVDCRGCGRSPLGDPDDFTTESVVEDIKRLADSHKLLLGGSGDDDGISGGQNRRLVLVGHSMGGRIAMCYAAKYPDDVAALVVEDMDIRRRAVSSNPMTLDKDMALSFGREFNSEEDALKAFTEVGYAHNMVSRWIDEGRIYKRISDGKIWSDVHPAFRLLCYRHFFDSGSGKDVWKSIADNPCRGTSKAKQTFPIHLMVAGTDDTVCDQASIQRMKEIMGNRLNIKIYLKARHSIHNSAREEFVEDLIQIIKST